MFSLKTPFQVQDGLKATVNANGDQRMDGKPDVSIVSA